MRNEMKRMKRNDPMEVKASWEKAKEDGKQHENGKNDKIIFSLKLFSTFMQDDEARLRRG